MSRLVAAVSASAVAAAQFVIVGNGPASADPRDAGQFLEYESDFASEFTAPFIPPASHKNMREPPIFVRVPGLWNRSAPSPQPCATVVEGPELCGPETFKGPCTAQLLWRLSDTQLFLGIELPRPAFTTGYEFSNDEHNHSVCVSPGGGPDPWGRGSDAASVVVVGRLSYYPKPKVRAFLPRVLRIGVRTFLNPGWYQEVPLHCVNCSSKSVIAVQPLYANHRCEELKGSVAAVVSATSGLDSSTAKWKRRGRIEEEVDRANEIADLWRKVAPAPRLSWARGLLCPPPDGGEPCMGYADAAFSTGQLIPGGGDDHSAVFTLASSRRLSAKQRRGLFHHRSAVCFYPDDSAPRGWLTGYAEFHMDGPDVQVFVGFVCFFGIAMPLICMVAALLHVSKQQRCKQHVQEIRLLCQRDQLERELVDRRHIRQAATLLSTGASAEAIAAVSPTDLPATASVAAALAPETFGDLSTRSPV